MQVALAACGIACPRDSDLQENALGTSLALPTIFRTCAAATCCSGKGHVAIVRDEATLIHANAFHMAVAIEPIQQAVARIRAAGSEVSSARRL